MNDHEVMAQCMEIVVTAYTAALEQHYAVSDVEVEPSLVTHVGETGVTFEVVLTPVSPERIAFRQWCLDHPDCDDMWWGQQ